WSGRQASRALQSPRPRRGPASGPPRRSGSRSNALGSASRAAGVGGCEPADRGPVEVLPAVGEQGEEAVAQQARQRQRDAQVLGGGEHEADVLLPERRSEA